VVDTLTVVTPWFPSPAKPPQGSFVQAAVRAVAGEIGRVEVVHTDEWITPAGPTGRAVESSYRRYAARAVRPRLQDDGTWLSRVPALVRPRRRWDVHSRTVSRSLAAARAGRPFESAVVHGHVVLPGGLVAVEHAAAGARVVVTEHASYLADVLAEPRARGLYDEVVDRAAALLCVSAVLRDQVLEAFPHHRAKVHVVPNPVEMAGPPRPDGPAARPRRWLFVGSLIERKGPLRLLDAFAACGREEPDLELTLLGTGPQREDVLARVAALGLGHAVHVVDPVPPGQVPEIMARHDLLVHPSHHETFGMTPVEAVAVGTPVLVARYPAAVEVLGGVEGTGGATFPVTDDPAEIVAGYRRLRDAWERLDLSGARAVLARRYGSPAVADALISQYTGPPAAAPLREGQKAS
jgi:glycogen synthase